MHASCRDFQAAEREARFTSQARPPGLPACAPLRGRGPELPRIPGALFDVHKCFTITGRGKIVFYLPQRSATPHIAEFRRSIAVCKYLRFRDEKPNPS